MASDFDFRLFSVNINGLRSRIKRKAIFRFLKENRYDIVCVQELYATKEVVETWRTEWGGELISNTFSSRSSGQLILLKKTCFL